MTATQPRLEPKDPLRFTTLAHSSHDFCNPLAPDTIDRFIEHLELRSGARVLDVGCGKGEFLIRVLARWKAHGTGIDPNPAFIADARRRAAGRVPAGGLELIEGEVAAADFAPASFDLVICIGAVHAFGTLTEALARLRELTRPGGLILLGHGFWQREPDAEYLTGSGGSRDELITHEGNLEAGREAGLEPLEAASSTPQDWDAYEGAYSKNIERWAASHTRDPERSAMLSRSRNWFAAYQKWGRDTMGFALYRFRRITP
jgi:cyclopropane fatty-acyl-phospholipid synthase-like methyltransferase